MTPDERWIDYRDMVLAVAFPNADLEPFRLCFFAGLFAYDFELQHAALIASVDPDRAETDLQQFHDALRKDMQSAPREESPCPSSLAPRSPF